MTSRAIAVALVVAAGATTASAQGQDEAGTSYSGGTIGARHRAQHTDVAFVTARAASGRISLLASVAPRCPSGPVSADVLVKDAPVKDGRFSSTAPYRRESDGETHEGTATVAGTVRDGAVTGSVRVRFALRDPAGADNGSCDSGTVRFTAVAPGRRGTRSTRVRDGAWLGAGGASVAIPGARLPVLIRVAGRGRRLAQAALAWNARCRGIEPFGAATVQPPLAVARDGSFSSTHTYTGDFGDAVGEYTSVLQGTLAPGTAKATWRVRMVLRKRAGGAIVARCDSGTIRFTARP